MSCALVTGGSGFIGKHLVRRLVARGDEVRCLVRSPVRGQELEALGAKAVLGELDNPSTFQSALAGVDEVYHLAGVTKSISLGEMYRVNEQGCRAVAQACAATESPPRLVVVSSIAAAGPAPRGQIRVESDPAAPVSHYGKSKLAGELAAAQLADRVPITIVRPGIVFGPGDAAFAKMFRAIRWLQFHASPGFSPPPLSYIYVDDLVEILVRASTGGQRVSESIGCGVGRYFAVAPEYPTYAELGKIARIMLRRPLAPVIPVAGPVAWCLAGASELVGRFRGQPEELNFDKLREALAQSWACSAEGVKRDLNFAPARSLQERLQETIDWYLREGWI